MSTYGRSLRMLATAQRNKAALWTRDLDFQDMAGAGYRTKR